MSKIFDSLVGHVIGDVMGTPIEYYMRSKLQENKVTEMLGNIGQHNGPVGSWSDDTAMELALIDSVINKKIIGYDDKKNILRTVVDMLNNKEKYEKLGCELAHAMFSSP